MSKRKLISAQDSNEYLSCYGLSDNICLVPGYHWCVKLHIINVSIFRQSVLFVGLIHEWTLCEKTDSMIHDGIRSLYLKQRVYYHIKIP